MTPKGLIVGKVGVNTNGEYFVRWITQFRKQSGGGYYTRTASALDPHVLCELLANDLVKHKEHYEERLQKRLKETQSE